MPMFQKKKIEEVFIICSLVIKSHMFCLTTPPNQINEALVLPPQFSALRNVYRELASLCLRHRKYF